MRKPLFTLLLLLPAFVFCQTSRLKTKKYQGLLWEITGKNLQKPSYLFGTMHVSSKLVFNLSDSFYLGLKNAEVVALETNPGTWQEDFSNYDLDGYSMSSAFRGNRGLSEPREYLSIRTLKAFPYEKLVEQALYSSPSMINSFLYRTNSSRSMEFEEDTYLDLYIYQIGRKWNKKVCGVENFDESMTLMREAYADAAKDRTQRMQGFDNDNEFSYAKLEDAYRTGNLDLLDTINKVNSVSAAFDEKFLYRRNEIQAHSIDSILKTGASLFVGVGAAHLPGYRGVIELLRQQGYVLRPVQVTERDSRNKEAIEAIRVPVKFAQQVSEDGFYSVSVPGKLYDFNGSDGPVEQKQFADMSNGSYYMVSRVFTNAGLWGHSPATVLKKVDSLLYENIPGKIISRKEITRNGYSGFDIINKTRRGDFQRYNIFVTPFEVILFKASGTGEYINGGKEAENFFSSIHLTEPVAAWQSWSPATGGFSVDLPQQPRTAQAGNFNYVAYDKATGIAYSIRRTDIYNVGFAEEDSFDLNLLEESFASSEFIDKQVSRKQTRAGGYAALDAVYKYKDGSTATVRFIVQGPHYYTLAANSKSAHTDVNRFIRSFSIKPFRYEAGTIQKDTTLKYTSRLPFLLEKPKKLSMYPENVFNPDRSLSDEDAALEERNLVRDRTIVSDSTGEEIYVAMIKPSRYFYLRDSTEAEYNPLKSGSQKWVYRSNQKQLTRDSIQLTDYELTEPGSGRVLRGRLVSKGGTTYRLLTVGDTLSKWSSFINDFYTSFQPFDSIRNDGQKKSKLFFADLASQDTNLHKKAILSISQLRFDSADFPQMKQAISQLTWKDKRYLITKSNFISKLAQIKSRESADYLGKLYVAAGDTIDLQYRALEALLQQRTNYSYGVFRNIMVTDPPVVTDGSMRGNRSYGPPVRTDGRLYSNGNFFDDLYDSLELTRTIMPGLLSLMTISDYERPIKNLLERMVDSNLVEAADYETYLPKLLIEAKQEWKKQVISEKSRAIQKAQDEPQAQRYRNFSGNDREEGNDKLDSYAVLLMPFWNRSEAVPVLFNQMLGSSDKRLRFNTMELLLRKGKPVPDSVILSFAAEDAYRAELYSELKDLKMLDRFPKKYYSHVLLAKSELKSSSYSVPDTLVYLERSALNYKERSGFIYFFKYKQKKEDKNWKIALAGLVPSTPDKYLFEFKGTRQETADYDFTELTNTRIEEDEPLQPQLQKELKKQLYGKRRSAARFYENGDRYDSAPVSFRD